MSYSTILIDPPWPETGGGKIKRGADRHYPTLPVDHIPRVIYSSGEFEPAKDAHLWIWSTNNYLIYAINMFSALGFRYVTNTVWVKMRCLEIECLELDSIKIATAHLQIGLGQYQRGSHEILLFGTRGKAMVPEPENRMPSVVFHPRGEHSEKPDIFYKRIELISPPPYLEMFARKSRDNWWSWGNEL